MWKVQPLPYRDEDPQPPTEVLHVFPVDDEIEHQGHLNCICHPALSFNEHGVMVVVHNAVDDRE